MVEHQWRMKKVTLQSVFITHTQAQMSVVMDGRKDNVVLEDTILLTQ